MQRNKDKLVEGTIYRIDTEAINSVSEKTGISKSWVELIHDNQWKKIKEHTQTGKRISASGFFNMTVKENIWKSTIIKVLYLQKLLNKYNHPYLLNHKKPKLMEKINKTIADIEHYNKMV